MVVPKSISENARIYSTTDVAEMLGVHRSTVHNWIKSGILKSEKHGASGGFHGITPKELRRFQKIYQVDTQAPPPKRKRSKRKRPSKRKKSVKRSPSKKKTKKRSKKR